MACDPSSLDVEQEPKLVVFLKLDGLSLSFNSLLSLPIWEANGFGNRLGKEVMTG